GGKLMEFEVEEDLPEAGSQIAGQLVGGIVGMSEDAGRVYFVSEEALAAGAVAGDPNLYLFEEGAYTFVATLSERDVSSFLTSNSTDPRGHVGRVTPDGGAVAFISDNELTGQDSADLNTGKPLSQVYLYDAGEDALRCVSCNRTGARPIGGDYGDVAPWLKADVLVAAILPSTENQLYESRNLSEDGRRVFFESFDALVPGDTNGQLDVYEWEAQGKGSCADPEGCTYLISSGQSPEPSQIVDADADGSDVFFATEASLLPQDPGLIDVYDARAGGGFPPSAPPKLPCAGDTCQSPEAAPDDPTPASSGFFGAGNVKEAATRRPKPCPKGRHKVKRKGKVRCVKDKGPRRRAVR
ncbi:MAG TPA: hypothetical protein VN733_02220, partial [Solirubrobacterales bacterium]|nr:hypothetical protein [Solirubrobacterales bacterium]